MSSRSAKLSKRFVEAGWLPPTKKDLQEFIRKLIHEAEKSESRLRLQSAGGDPITEAIIEFRNFIIRDADMFMGFNRMFEENKDDVGIDNFEQFINLLEWVLHNAPSFGPFGPPVYMLLFRAMNTQGGFTAFLADKLNHHFKHLFNLWAVYLDSPASRNVLNDQEGGWFHRDAVDATTADYPEQAHIFSDIFISDMTQPYWGFKSWDDFFVRRFVEVPRPGVPLPRPVEYPPPNPKAEYIIGGACESVLYNIRTGVKREDAFWIKGEPYSLEHMLKPSAYTIPGTDDVVGQFVGGTILQGFLQVTGYHRWAAPVSGTIVKIVDIPGTYFVQSPALLPRFDPGSKLWDSASSSSMRP